ncbi:MAG: hypothetical protein ACREMP_10375 [Candidatus Tyrphobacter sp.]
MLASILLSTLLAQAPAAAAPAAPQPNAAVDERAREWFSRLQSGRIDYSQLDAQASAPLNSDVVLIISTNWSALGRPVAFEQVHSQAPTVTDPNSVYVYRVTFKNDVACDFFFGIDPQGNISGMRLGPQEY